MERWWKKIEENKSLITIKQIPVIEAHLDQFSASLKEKIEFANSLVCTEDSISKVKQIRADITKYFNELEKIRKAVKCKVLEPYEAFEKIYKEKIEIPYKESDEKLKSKIDEINNKLKEDIKAEVVEYFNECLASYGIDFVTFDRANIKILLSESISSLKKQAKAFVEKIHNDLQLIDTQEHRDEILIEYKESLNVSDAILKVTNRHKELERVKQDSEQRKLQQERLNETEKAVDNIIAPPTEINNKILTAVFEVKGTKDQLKRLVCFMKQNKIEYRDI